MAEGKNLVGVDIGSSSIKVCELKEARKGHTLVKLAYASLPPQTIVDGHIINSGVVTETLSKLFADGQIKQRNVALSVSGQSVIIRKITVPMMTPEELNEQIHWEAEQHIPFDIKDVQIDYEVLKRQTDRGQMDLLLVAAKRDEINDYAQLVREAKLRPLVVDIDAFTVQNIFEMAHGIEADETIAIINLGASLSSINIVSGGVSAFTRDIASGGNAITEEIQRQTGSSFEQAEAYKYGDAAAAEAGGVGIIPQQVHEIIESVSDSIAAEIQRSLDFYMATSGEGEIKRIHVTGGTASLTVLRAAIERRARTTVEFFNPMARIAVDAQTVSQGLLQQRQSQLSVALGLALRKEREKRA